MWPRASPSAILLADDGVGDGHLSLRDTRARVEHHVSVFQDAGFEDIVLVRRREAASLVPTFKGVTVVLSPAHEGRSTESLLFGLFACEGAPAFVQPTSSDVISSSTLALLLELISSQEEQDITRALAGPTHRNNVVAYAPSFRGRVGFPLVLLSRAVERLVHDRVPPGGGKSVLGAILSACGSGVAMVEVDDAAVISSATNPGID